MTLPPSHPAREKVELIKHILNRVGDEELIDDLLDQLKVVLAKYMGIQSKVIKTTMFDVDNFFEGVNIGDENKPDPDDTIKPSKKKKKD